MANEAEEIARGGGRLRTTGIALAAIALTGFFMILGFPYDRLAQRLAERVERQTGVRITLGEVSLGLVRWGPGIAAEPVQVVGSDGARIALERVGVRPALALSWLRGVPALATDVASARGGASGVLRLGEEERGFAGRIVDLDLELLPQEDLGAPLRIEGRSDADVDLVLGEAGPVGSVVFEARDGMVSHPALPLPLPFQKASGDVDLGGEEWVRLRRFDLESPLANGRGRGSVGHAPRFSAAPLRLQLEVTVSGAIQGSLRSQGVEVGNQGQIRVDVTGTPSRPVVR